jgi:Tol biopolymer transport system component
MFVVWMASVAGGAPAVPVASVSGANLQRPCWSPDGRLLSFEANFHDEKRIELYLGEPREGGFDRVVGRSRATSALTDGFKTAPTGGQVAHELAWAPRGIDAFVFAASNDLFDYDLYISEGTTVAGAPGADGGAQWSPDGGHIAFTSARTGEGDLYLVDTHHIEAPPRRLTEQPGTSELYLDWSHDGRSLVFVSHSPAGDNLWLLPALPDASNKAPAPARLTAWPGNQIRPRFSPTENRIAFYANHEDPARFDLYVVEIGSAPQLVVRGVYPDVRGPSWTDDGKHLVYVAEDDEAYDPVRAVRVDDPSRVATLDLDTVGNGDLDVTTRDGATWVAVVSQGRRADTRRDFKRLYVAPVSNLP